MLSVSGKNKASPCSPHATHVCSLDRRPLFNNSRPFLSSAQSLCCVQLYVTLWTAACQASLSFTISQSLLKLMPIELVMPSNHLILCHPLLLLPSIFPSIKVFSNESLLHIRWSKDWNFSFSISPSNEYSELTSIRIDWFDLLAVQGTLKSLLQYHMALSLFLLCTYKLNDLRQAIKILRAFSMGITKTSPCLYYRI